MAISRNLIGFLDAFKAPGWERERIFGCDRASLPLISVASWFETRGAAALLTMRVQDLLRGSKTFFEGPRPSSASAGDLILRSPPEAGISKDEAACPDPPSLTRRKHFA